LIDGIFKITNDNLNDKPAILPIDIAVEKIIKEFQELSENQ
ncbi:unnamed protein product, partial [marine sediment metagenome]